MPWDDPSDPDGLREYATDRGIGFDAMNSNTFQDNPSTTGDGSITYKYGSLANSDPAVRELAVEHNQYVIDLGVRLGSKALTVWLADGINHPGQLREAERIYREKHPMEPARRMRPQIQFTEDDDEELGLPGVDDPAGRADLDDIEGDEAADGEGKPDGMRLPVENEATEA